MTAGCGDNYCPDDSITRSQIAVFQLQALEGGDYEPTSCPGTFADVDCSSLFAAWIEDLTVISVARSKPSHSTTQ